MSNEIILKEVNGEILVGSREIAERFSKQHKDVLDSIRNLIAENSAVKNLFIETEYVSERGRKYPEYEMNRDGFSLLAMGFTGKEALKWKLDYIDAFNKMENHIKQQNNRSLPSSYKEALVQLLEQVEQNEKLLDEVDKYQRFLCEKTGCLTKTELATKLDTKVQTLAVTLKKVGIYTKTSQVSEDFLKKYPNIKLIIDKITTYTDPKTKEEKEDKTFQWTFEGAKTVVDYLISIGMVTYTDNNGFKLMRE
jgi:anti-repressor protein